MTNQELQIRLAEATGWIDVQRGHLTGFLIAHYVPGPSVSSRTVLIGRRRPGAEYEEIPNWPEDLPACMRDLWPWLSSRLHCMGLGHRKNGLWLVSDIEEDGVVLWYGEQQGPKQTKWEQGDYRNGDGSKTEALALCYAVLAVAEKIKEQANDSKG